MLAEVRGQSREDYNGGIVQVWSVSPASKIIYIKKPSTRNQQLAEMKETSASTENKTKDRGSLQ